MKMRIIRLAIGLTSLVTSFLPQKAAADVCTISCGDGSSWTWCIAAGTHVECKCVGEQAVCSS